MHPGSLDDDASLAISGLNVVFCYSALTGNLGALQGPPGDPSGALGWRGTAPEPLVAPGSRHHADEADLLLDSSVVQKEQY